MIISRSFARFDSLRRCRTDRDGTVGFVFSEEWVGLLSSRPIITFRKLYKNLTLTLAELDIAYDGVWSL